jgi:hypothetical protein
MSIEPTAIKERKFQQRKAHSQSVYTYIPAGDVTVRVSAEFRVAAAKDEGADALST